MKKLIIGATVLTILAVFFYWVSLDIKAREDASVTRMNAVIDMVNHHERILKDIFVCIDCGVFFRPYQIQTKHYGRKSHIRMVQFFNEEKERCKDCFALNEEAGRVARYAEENKEKILNMME